MIEYRNEYITVPDYAKRCGITSRAAHQRVKKHLVAALEVDGFIFIPVAAAQPVRRINPHLTRNGKKMKGVTFMKMNEWHDVTRYAYAHKITAGVIFRLMITGKIDGLVIADHVFFKPSQLP